MNKQKSSSKTMITVGVIAVAAAAVYFYYQGKTPIESSGLQAETTNSESMEIAQLLAQVGAIRIDSKFFSDPAFKSLIDYNVPIPAQNVGRANPFAPIPGLITESAGGNRSANQR